MLFNTTDDRIKKLERRVGEMEKQTNRALTSINDAFVTITDVITKLEKENVDLKKEKISIMSSREKVEKQIKEIGIKREIKSNVVEPVKNAITENFDFIQEVAKESIATQSSPEELLKLVDDQGEIRMQDAAAKLKVHELQVEHWANNLKDRMEITEKKNKKYLSKIKPSRK